MSIWLMVIMCIAALLLFGVGFSYGRVAIPKQYQPSTRCSCYEGIITDWMKKNQIIHRLETRIYRLKIANRNLREEIKKKAAP